MGCLARFGGKLARAPDRHIIEWTRGEGCICVTRDADFHALLAASRAKPSVVRIRVEPLGYEQAAEIIRQVWDRFENSLDRGAVVTVTPAKMRSRRLPLMP